ncbi:MAG: pitrilysin family protein [Chloroflexota bacterium]
MEEKTTYEKSTLANGLRIVSFTMPHTYSVCISIFVGVGSRYEDADKAGVSHFIEHLCFKGTTRRTTAKDICEAIEGVGGILNGGTDRELTVYWCKVARPHYLLALDVLLDMLRDSKFDPTEVEKERRVIIEELSAAWDSPHQRVDSLIDEVLWPDQALGRDVAGTKESVSAISRAAMLEFLTQRYFPGNAVVSVAGDIGHGEVVGSLEQTFDSWPQGSPGSWYPAVDEQNAPRLRLESRKTEQAHLCLAVPGLSFLHPDRFALDLLNVILGECMSSRLFTEIREKRGLAYDIHSYVSHYRDSGALTVYAGVHPKQADDAIRCVLAELARIRDEPIPSQEMVKAKELSKGRLLLRMEDTRSVSGWMGGQELLTGHIYTVDEIVKLVDDLTPEDLHRVARNLLGTGRLNLAVVGPFRSERRFERLLRL